MYIWHAPQKQDLWNIFHWYLGLTHRYIFSLNFWGESCLFTILTKKERSECSFDEAFITLSVVLLNLVKMSLSCNQMHVGEKV